MLRELIKQNNVSVYAVSKGSGVPYTTLNELVNGKKNLSDCSVKTVVALAAYFGMSMDAVISYIDGSNDSIKVNPTWEAKRLNRYIFPVIAPAEGYDASRIYPLKQHIVKQIYQTLSSDNRIKTLTLFGSSVNIRCTKESDLDICIGLKDEYNSVSVKNEISERIQELVNWKADIIWADKVEIGSRLGKNIAMGVKII